MTDHAEDIDTKMPIPPCHEEFDPEGNPRRVENLHFIDGVLGTGAFGTVRLAKRILSDPPPPPPSPPTSPSTQKHNSGLKSILSSPRRIAKKSKSEPNRGSDFFSGEFKAEATRNIREQTPSPSVIDNLGLLVRSKVSFDLRHEEEELVAVKIFSKSILKRRRTMERDKSSQKIKIKTAMQQVEREIALMKKLNHPNLVSLYEVIDSEHSDMLYMVLEFLPGGEIMSYQDDGTFRRKEPKRGCPNGTIEGVVHGHFDEEHAALYFVDILHGLAYLHQHHICHRDLKPENILLDADGIAKVGDFGVSHIFEKESEFGISEFERSESFDEMEKHSRHVLTRMDTDSALELQRLSSFGMLTKTEGTWCFWSPEMCEGSKKFSGYAADMWAAGVCLYIFVTGKLPFYSEIPTELFEIISKAEIDVDKLGLSHQLVDLLKRCLEKDPDKRAGVGECLSHPFLKQARRKRIKQLSLELESSRRRKIVLSEHDIKTAFKAVTGLPVYLIRSASKTLHASSKKLQEGLERLPHARLFHKQGSNASSHSSSDMVQERHRHRFGNSFRARMRSKHVFRKHTSSTSEHSSSSSAIATESQIKLIDKPFHKQKKKQKYQKEASNNLSANSLSFHNDSSSTWSNDAPTDSPRNGKYMKRLPSGITSASSFETSHTSLGELPISPNEEDEKVQTEEVVGDTPKRRKSKFRLFRLLRRKPKKNRCLIQ